MEKSIKKRIKEIKKGMKLKGYIISIIIGILIILGVFIGIVGWGIYELDWQNDFVIGVSAIIPYPAAKVGNSFITYYEFNRNLAAADKFYDSQRELGFKGIPPEDELRKIVLEDRLIINLLVKKIAQKYNLKVSQEEIGAEYDEIVKKRGNEEDLIKFLRDYYDINGQEYKKYFIEPNLIRDKVNQAVIEDNELNGAAREKIEEALNKLKEGGNFEELADQYNETETTQAGGAIGNYLRGELPKDIEDQLFAMEPGQFTDIISLPDNLQIIKLEEKNEELGVLTLKAIIVKITSLEELIAEEKVNSNIKIYIY